MPDIIRTCGKLYLIVWECKRTWEMNRFYITARVTGKLSFNMISKRKFRIHIIKTLVIYINKVKLKTFDIIIYIIKIIVENIIYD